MMRLLLVSLLAAAVLTGDGPARAAALATPDAVIQTYLRAVYARDYRAAYDLISAQDRNLKSKPEYLRESGTFTGSALQAARELAGLIRFEDFKTARDGNHAVVTFRAVLPDANAPAVQELLLDFDEARLAALSQAERGRRLAELRALARRGLLPVVVGEHERWELVREGGRWRVFLNWAGAVLVRFESISEAGLPWTAAPVQAAIRAKPGETLHTAYRVKNVGDREITAKARHVLDPPEDTGHLQIVSCFCLLQQTLRPGEERELPVTFRVSYEVPESIREVRVRYEFYPLERFPGEAVK